MKQNNKQNTTLSNIESLKLSFVAEHYESLAQEAARKNWTYVDYLSRLMEGEANARQEKIVQRKLSQARFPILKTIEDFNWTWPTKLNRAEVQNLFRLNFIKQKENVIFLGGVGLGKTHLATALGITACTKGHSVLFTTAIDVINTLYAAQKAGRFKKQLHTYLKPQVLILNELGYLPIDKNGGDLLFQIISQRYCLSSTIVTSNKAYKKWPEIFNNDSTLTSAILDRLLHYSHSIPIQGKSFRMKNVNPDS